MSLSEHHGDPNTGEEALVAEALRLEAEGRSQRQIAAALGKPRHWVRFVALTKTGPAIGAAPDIAPVSPLGWHRALSRFVRTCAARPPSANLAEGLFCLLGGWA